MYLQITGETVGEVRVVSGMHQRKAEMAKQADAFIALPGTNFHVILVNITIIIIMQYCNYCESNTGIMLLLVH